MAKMETKKTAHEFAVFHEGASRLRPDHYTVDNPDSVHRLKTVLRLAKGDSVILFDRSGHVLFTIHECGTKKVTGTVGVVQKNAVYTPSVTLFLPVLKREALEQAIYGAVECGVTTIQLVTTGKVQRKWQGKTELARVERIAIAAAEQSKCFAVAHIFEPLSLEAALQEHPCDQLFFADPAGGQLKRESQKSCGIIVGPEGDLLEEEKQFLRAQNVQFYRLTPTILRAQQAAILSVGMMRAK